MNYILIIIINWIIILNDLIYLIFLNLVIFYHLIFLFLFNFYLSLYPLMNLLFKNDISNSCLKKAFVLSRLWNSQKFIFKFFAQSQKLFIIWFSPYFLNSFFKTRKHFWLANRYLWIYLFFIRHLFLSFLQKSKIHFSCEIRVSIFP